MHRITLKLDDDLYRKLTAKAAKEQRTVSALASDMLQRELARENVYKLNLQGFKGELQPGVDVCDRNSLFAPFDEGKATPDD